MSTSSKGNKPGSSDILSFFKGLGGGGNNNSQQMSREQHREMLL